MRLRLRTLRTRSVSAIVFVAVFLLLFWANQWTFLLLFTIIHFGCWGEFQRIVSYITNGQPAGRIYTFAVSMCGWGVMLWPVGSRMQVNVGNSAVSLGFLGEVITLLFVLLIPLVSVLFHMGNFLKQFLFFLLGIVYISVPCMLAIHLKLIESVSLTDTIRLVLLSAVVFSVWLNDSFAYIFGSLFGKRKVFKSISPNKTLEGTVIGFSLTLLVGAIVGYVFFESFFWLLLGTVFVGTFFGILGDLFESLLKRCARVKDSGKIMPGHGGFLDRFDSLLFALPYSVLWIFVYEFFYF